MVLILPHFSPKVKPLSKCLQKERDRMNEHIGAKIKHLRTQRKMTLKDLSEKTNLSIGFLSQLERGLTSIATDTLGTIADVFEVELSYFFLKPRTKKKAIIRSYEKEVFNICTSGCIQYNLSNDLNEKKCYLDLLIYFLIILMKIYNHICTKEKNLYMY